MGDVSPHRQSISGQLGVMWWITLKSERADALLVGAALLRLALGCIDQRHNIIHRPKPIGNASRRRGRDPQCLMPTREVVEQEVDRERVAVVFDLFGERIGAPVSPR